jgi:hypothetical protein
MNVASASYITGDIFIQETGATTFDIETDIPLEIEGLNFNDDTIIGSTEIFTIKEKGAWTFSLDLGEYETMLLDIHLPKNLDSIVSIQGVDNIIDIDSRVITLIDSGKLDFTISYSTKETQSFVWIAWPIIFIIIITGYFLFKHSRKQKDRLTHIMPIVSDIEQKIIEILMKAPMRQKELRKKLEIPKASFSRYMVNLERKKLIQREGEGKNKIVKLK